MERSVDLLIYFYVFICLSLLLFNLLYILRSKRKKRKKASFEQKWLECLKAEWDAMEVGGSISEKHIQLLERRLTNVEYLITYHEAVMKGRELYPDGRVQRYLDALHMLFQKLAVEYGKREPMERAFYAYLMSVYHPNRNSGGVQFAKILLTYFHDSTIYCRENVLQALYAFGQDGIIERAFAMMSQQGLYHHPRLLSDGLAGYAGDKRELAWKLWKNGRDWEEHLQVAVVQFATGISDEFAQEFLIALKDENTNLEVRFALLRYFRRWRCPQVKEYLLELLTKEAKNNLAIVAATVLESYPGEDTHAALLQAMRSRNWYVRQNAAESLVALGYGAEDLEKLRAYDSYGADMLEYKMQQRQFAHEDRLRTEEAKEAVRV